MSANFLLSPNPSKAAWDMWKSLFCGIRGIFLWLFGLWKMVIPTPPIHNPTQCRPEKTTLERSRLAFFDFLSLERLLVRWSCLLHSSQQPSRVLRALGFCTLSTFLHRSISLSSLPLHMTSCCLYLTTPFYPSLFFRGSFFTYNWSFFAYN